MTARSAPPSRCGFASITAITLIGLVATVLAAMGILFAAELRRTRWQGSEIQLRQLLLAGAAAAQQSVARDPSSVAQQDLLLPPPLADDGQLTLSIQPGGEQVVVAVRARVGQRRAEQSLHFVRSGDVWKLSRVETGQ